MKNYIKALIIMYRANRKQKDKAGKPYFLHPLKVALNTKTKESKIVALLHDVLEDSDIYRINDFNFLDTKQKSALILLNHDKNIDYFEYINKLKTNSIAREVKIADLLHNTNLSRLKNITDKDVKRVFKYLKAIEILVK